MLIQLFIIWSLFSRQICFHQAFYAHQDPHISFLHDFIRNFRIALMGSCHLMVSFTSQIIFNFFYYFWYRRLRKIQIVLSLVVRFSLG